LLPAEHKFVGVNSPTDMLAFLGKKKLSDEGVANIFVNTLLDTVEKGFPEVAGFINDSPEFIRSPKVSSEDYGRFLMISIAGNINGILEHFSEGHEKEIVRHIAEKFAVVFEMAPDKFAELIKEYRQFMARVNHPSKNTVYAMSKTVFYKYELNDFQETYFRNLNTPNPIFLKNLDEIMKNFLWDWNAFTDKYKLVS
jgi:hypothetical protein